MKSKMYLRIRRIVVSGIGFLVLFIGILMIFLPGPAFVFIPLGLLILASEFDWAKRWLEKIKKKIEGRKD